MEATGLALANSAGVDTLAQPLIAPPAAAAITYVENAPALRLRAGAHVTGGTDSYGGGGFVVQSANPDLLIGLAAAGLRQEESDNGAAILDLATGAQLGGVTGPGTSHVKVEHLTAAATPGAMNALLTVEAVDDAAVAQDDIAYSAADLAQVPATDSFTYTLDGGSVAIVTLHLAGAGPVIVPGTGGNDTVTSFGSHQLFDLSQGGNDVLHMGLADNAAWFGAALRRGARRPGRHPRRRYRRPCAVPRPRHAGERRDAGAAARQQHRVRRQRAGQSQLRGPSRPERVLHGRDLHGLPESWRRAGTCGSMRAPWTMPICARSAARDTTSFSPAAATMRCISAPVAFSNCTSGVETLAQLGGTAAEPAHHAITLADDWTAAGATKSV